MSSNGNKYILRICYNYPGEPEERFPYNSSIDYAVRNEKGDVVYLTALYDEEFSGNHIPNEKFREEKVLLCGSLTHGYYKVSNKVGGAQLSFVTVYPEKISIAPKESLKFAYGEIYNVAGGIYAKGSDTGLALQSANKVAPITWKMGVGINKLLAERDRDNVFYYDYNSNRKHCERDSSCEALSIPKKI